MAIFKPFRGILYSKEKLHDISSVIAPPYDVLTPEDVKRYEKKNEFNVVRLIQSRERVLNGKRASRYEVARYYFNKWLEEGVLKRDRKPAIYLYEHQFTINRKKFKRTGFISAVRLEDFSSGKVLPHENTFAGPIEDRFKLTLATNANFCSIFSLFSDPNREFMDIVRHSTSISRVYSAVDEERCQHKIYRITDIETINAIRELLSGKSFLIADGHHRYETALRYRDYIRSKYKGAGGEISADYVMMYLTPMEAEGLVILPIYRLIKSGRKKSEEILKKAERYFYIKKLSDIKSAKEMLEKKALTNFKGFVAMMDSGDYMFELKSTHIMNEFNPDKFSKARLLLNVSILHLLFIEHVVGLIGKDAEKNIHYSHNLDELIQKRGENYSDAIILLNPPTIQEIKAVAENNERMPHKSTFFYPKLLSGLVFRSIDE